MVPSFPTGLWRQLRSCGGVRVRAACQSDNLPYLPLETRHKAWASMIQSLHTITLSVCFSCFNNYLYLLIAASERVSVCRDCVSPCCLVPVTGQDQSCLLSHWEKPNPQSQRGATHSHSFRVDFCILCSLWLLILYMICPENIKQKQNHATPQISKIHLAWSIEQWVAGGKRCSAIELGTWPKTGRQLNFHLRGFQLNMEKFTEFRASFVSALPLCPSHSKHCSLHLWES